MSKVEYSAESSTCSAHSLEILEQELSRLHICSQLQLTLAITDLYLHKNKYVIADRIRIELKRNF
jgi:hypothetical protein